MEYATAGEVSTAVGNSNSTHANCRTSHGRFLALAQGGEVVKWGWWGRLSGAAVELRLLNGSRLCGAGNSICQSPPFCSRGHQCLPFMHATLGPDVTGCANRPAAVKRPSNPCSCVITHDHLPRVHWPPNDQATFFRHGWGC